MSLKKAKNGSNGSFNERNAGMNWLKTFLKALLIAVTALQITACSKTVQWEEEVPLNTGETIWVKRTVEYKLKGAGGNPFDMAYRPDWTEEIAFEWKGKKYSYVGDADLMLLAISPHTQRPVLVAQAANKQWSRQNNYRCTTPFYVQFVPTANGKEWSWPPNIEPWLYEMDHNLMANKSEADHMMKRYTISDRADIDRAMTIQSPSDARIIPTFKFAQCFN
jgi:hypothetical protein